MYGMYKEPKDEAREIINWLQEAVGDLAYDTISYIDDYPEFKKKIAIAKKQRVKDITGWLADEFYNDPDELIGLLGDKVYEYSLKRPNDTKELLNKLMNYAHDALEIAITKLREMHEDW